MPAIAGSLSSGAPTVRISVSSPVGSPEEVEAVIDTGFDGCLRVPLHTALDLGLRFSDLASDMETADGRVVSVPLAPGVVRLGDETREVLVHVQQSAEEALVGIDFLRAFGKVLVIDVAGGAVLLVDRLSDIVTP